MPGRAPTQRKPQMPVGELRDDVLRRARQAETALGITKWLTSPDHT